MLRRGRARRGMTLLEICVVIGVGSIIFATAVVVVAGLLRSRVDQEQQRYFAATRTRLADQFREDVRAAKQWRADDEEGPAWVLELSVAELVRYHVEGSALLRVRRNKGVDVARERFSQTAGTTFEIHKIASAEGRSPMVELVIDYPGDRHSTGRKRHRVVGNLAADSRFVFR